VRGCLPHHRMPTPQRTRVGATSRELVAKAERYSEQGGRATARKQMQLRLLHNHKKPSAWHTRTVIHTAPLPRPSRQENVAHPMGAVTHAMLQSVSCRIVDMLLLLLLLLCRLLRLVSSATPARARQSSNSQTKRCVQTREGGSRRSGSSTVGVVGSSAQGTVTYCGVVRHHVGD
jgi:hypothetical protein